MSLLTEETKIFLDGLKNLNLPTIDKFSVDILREQYEAMSILYGGPDLKEVFFVNAEVQKIPVRHYTYPDAQHIILYAHGGGWTRGSLNTHHVMCQNLCKATRCNLVAVDYSLSPENIYPKALDEIEIVYNLLQEFNLKNLPVTIAGDSAGANLMAALVVRLNVKQKAIPERAIFFYPSLDLKGQSKSLNEFAEGYLLTKHSVEYYVNNYLGNNLNMSEIDEVSPLRQMHSINFPNTLIIAAQCDPIRDDSRQARDILKNRNLLMGYLEVPGVIHGFAQFPGLFPEALKAFEWIENNYI
jgi:acetyl esterase